jgi:hypothetical protein
MMTNNKYEGTGYIIVGFIVRCIAFTWAIMQSITCAKDKNSKNLKCVQGELYEEISPNFYVKSHLECFEVRTF